MKTTYGNSEKKSRFPKRVFVSESISELRLWKQAEINKVWIFIRFPLVPTYGIINVWFEARSLIGSYETKAKRGPELEGKWNYYHCFFSWPFQSCQQCKSMQGKVLASYNILPTGLVSKERVKSVQMRGWHLSKDFALYLTDLPLAYLRND